MMNRKVSDQEIRDYYEEKRKNGTEAEGLVRVDAAVPKNFGSIFSVRFNQGELGLIQQIANQRGIKVGAFIREAALKAALDGDAGSGAKINLTPSEQETLFQALRQVIAPKPEPARQRRTRRSNTATEKA